jgi:phenylacetate-CoA ligase
MHLSLEKLYHCLPARARTAAASLRGLYLRRWRYGSDTDRLVAASLERESWSADQWRSWQEQELTRLLRRAATRVPYYRDQWARRRRLGDTASWDELFNWPILEKESLRANPGTFLADDCDPRRMFHGHTSGTTGKSLDLFISRDALVRYFALYEARNRGWHGVSRHDRWAILGGQLVVPIKTRRPPFWVWNCALNQLYMSAYHLAPDLIPYYLEALQEYRVRYLLGYPSAILPLAQECLRLGYRGVKLRVVVTNAEPLLAHQRELIAEAFQCPVRETYGMTEHVTEASECSHGRLHLWPELGFTEAVNGARPAADGTQGDLVCTGLLNADMPLIRYRVGDRGTLASPALQCECGRTLPILETVEGRIDDTILTADGRTIGRLDPVFKSNLPVREAQIIQEEVNRLRVRYVPDVGFQAMHAKVIVRRLCERVGEMEVILEEVKEIPRTARGKFQAVVCRLSDKARRDADAGPRAECGGESGTPDQMTTSEGRY